MKFSLFKYIFSTTHILFSNVWAQNHKFSCHWSSKKFADEMIMLSLIKSKLRSFALTLQSRFVNSSAWK